MTAHHSVLGNAKTYVASRWKKRWPIVPVVPFVIVGWAMTHNQNTVRQQLHRTVIGAVVFIIVIILFPARWGGEDWEKPKT